MPHPKSRQTTTKAKPKAKLILKRRGGRKREQHAGLACYGYQKQALKGRAKAAAARMGYKDMSVSAYLNMLLWKDWL